MILLGTGAILLGGAQVASQWRQPLRQTVDIDLSFWSLSLIGDGECDGFELAERFQREFGAVVRVFKAGELLGWSKPRVRTSR